MKSDIVRSTKYIYFYDSQYVTVAFVLEKDKSSRRM